MLLKPGKTCANKLGLLAGFYIEILTQVNHCFKDSIIYFTHKNFKEFIKGSENIISFTPVLPFHIATKGNGHIFWKIGLYNETMYLSWKYLEIQYSW